MVTHKVTVNGPAALTGGFVGNITSWTIGGYGLVTFGFLWGLNDIWTPCCEAQEVTWEACDCNASCD